MLEQIKVIISRFYTEDYLMLLAVLVLIILAYIYRANLVIKTIIKESLEEMESKLNSKTGQDFLDNTVLKANEKIKTATWIFRIPLRLFCQKKVLVTLIEKAMNKTKNAFDIEGDNIDIIGNEEDKKKLE